ncbi:hypothetical protein H5410_013943 [Solanum commersonii]|uniref:Uncharacterized protein n=1 Tax=Solanum commersonii TaxID=4109 RepID=A0A9J5ZPZ2_SOLCO|nr:hypothetical protein H5410_013943 [Solanum commersonii]
MGKIFNIHGGYVDKANRETTGKKNANMNEVEACLWSLCLIKRYHQNLKVSSIVVARPILLYEVNYWLCDISDKIGNENILDKVRETFVVDNMREARLQLFVHVNRSCADVQVRKCKRLDIVG